MARLIDEVRQLLRESGDLSRPEGHSERELIRTLTMLINDGEDIVRQRACRELGKIISGMDPSKIEDIIRRLLWRLNPESGDNPLGVPELLGEIGNGAPQQIGSFVPVIMQYFEDEKLRPGLLQAAGRIGHRLPDAVTPHIDEIASCLRSTDVIVSANAVLALRRIGGSRAEEALHIITNDTREITIFHGGESRTTRICELAGHSWERTPGICFITNQGQA